MLQHRADRDRTGAKPEPAARPARPAEGAAERWQAPRYEVIALACEITAYAPDDTPLF